MAISLGFGILFATFVILLIVPASYAIVEDVKWFFGIGRYAKKKVDVPPEPTLPAEPEVVDVAAT